VVTEKELNVTACNTVCLLGILLHSENKGSMFQRTSVNFHQSIRTHTLKDYSHSNSFI
jgi:hypothetical protein